MNFESIINLSDAFTLFLAVPNLFAVFLLSNLVIKEFKRYCKKYNIGIYSSKERLNDEERMFGDSRKEMSKL